MQKLKIVQYFIDLPKDKRVPALLLFFILLSLSSTSAMYFVMNGYYTTEKREHREDNTYYQKQGKTKDSIINAVNKDFVGFIKEQYKIGNKHQWEIDSIKAANIIKK